MTVSELRKKLEGLPEELPVLVYEREGELCPSTWEDLIFAEVVIAHDAAFPDVKCVGIATRIPTPDSFTPTVELEDGDRVKAIVKLLGFSPPFVISG